MNKHSDKNIQNTNWNIVSKFAMCSKNHINPFAKKPSGLGWIFIIYVCCLIFQTQTAVLECTILRFSRDYTCFINPPKFVVWRDRMLCFQQQNWILSYCECAKYFTCMNLVNVLFMVLEMLCIILHKSKCDYFFASALLIVLFTASWIKNSCAYLKVTRPNFKFRFEKAY